ncbi:hypothetical protein [Psittacicella gerlachiana]|uniref:Uncharacterized protein n=1 Tax=Psittacicella gerlachiana TaxID=2028574 RepID=A0A3A1YBJ5_9GAMM|nr:hypothetical protein [Psittacicella gerlachiana]RIY34736.1 hypothetical protein CKF59_04945 [Psittacicella gerlachiana]
MKFTPFLALACGVLSSLTLVACDQPQSNNQEHSSTDALNTDLLSADFCNNPENADNSQCQYIQPLQGFDPIAYLNSYKPTYVDSGVLVKVNPQDPEQVLPRIKYPQRNPFFNDNFDLYSPVFLALVNDFQNASVNFYYQYSSNPVLSQQMQQERQESKEIFFRYYGYYLPPQELTNFNFLGLSVNSYEYPVALLFREANNLVYRIIGYDFDDPENNQPETLSEGQKQERINREILRIMQLMATQFYAIKEYNQLLAVNKPEQLELLTQNGYNINNQTVNFSHYLAALYTWTQQGHLEINPRDPVFAPLTLAKLQQICPQCQFVNSPFDYQFALNRLGSLIAIFYHLSLEPAWQALEAQAITLAQQIQQDSKQPLYIDITSSDYDLQLYTWLDQTRSSNNQQIQVLVNLIQQENYFYLVAKQETKPLILRPITGQTFHYDYSFSTVRE